MDPILLGYLTAVGTVTGITTVLSVLILVADAYIADYGEKKLVINDEKDYVVEGGKPLLSTLKDQQVFIPSACGGRGSCGLCKCKVVAGGGEHLPTELPFLSPEEIADNVRLSCQLKVKQDMRIEIPEELFKVRQFRSRVARLRDLTHDIKEVTLELLEPGEIDYRAGQFIQFEVPPYELSAEAVYRAYSMSSHPVEKGKVELEIRLVPNGICTTYVHKHLREGHEVTINGPYGDFFLRDTEAHVIMIAGGSGMAPMKSILLQMVEDGCTRRCTYFFGARSKRDLFLLDEMAELEKKLPNFTFVPALSQPLPEDGWTGATGLITDVVAEHLGRAEDGEGYLCGSPGMIDACVKTLTSLGLPEDKIYYDKFA